MRVGRQGYEDGREVTQKRGRRSRGREKKEMSKYDGLSIKRM
jgi:hypothetical protein